MPNSVDADERDWRCWYNLGNVYELVQMNSIARVYFEISMRCKYFFLIFFVVVSFFMKGFTTVESPGYARPIYSIMYDRVKILDTPDKTQATN